MKIKIFVFLVFIAALSLGIYFFLEQKKGVQNPEPLFTIDHIINSKFFIPLLNTDVSFIDGEGEFKKDNSIFTLSFYKPTGFISISEEMSVGIFSLTKDIEEKEFYIFLFSHGEEGVNITDSMKLPEAMDVAHLFIDFDVSNEVRSLLYVSTFTEKEGVMIPVTYQIYVSLEGFTVVPQSDGSLSEEFTL